jgi:hypothetical protein
MPQAFRDGKLHFFYGVFAAGRIPFAPHIREEHLL